MDAQEAFDQACDYDSTGHPDLAVPLYREALEGELPGENRRRAVIQLASSLRNLGEAEESVALLTPELDALRITSTTPSAPSWRWPWSTWGASARRSATP
jgi:hypothetical protein